MIKKFWAWWGDHRTGAYISIVGLALFGALYLFRLGSHVPGNSVFEQAGFLGVNSKQAIIENISFAPLKLLQAIAVKIDDPNATLLRLLSVGCVFIALISLYFVLERWHTARIALMATVLFATSSYSLHQGRFAGHEVLYLGVIPVLLSMGIWLRSKRHVSKLPFALVVASLMLYIPGVWLMVLTLGIVFRRRLLLAWKFVNHKRRIMAVSGVVISLMPLLVSLVRNPEQLPVILGLDRLSSFGINAVLQQLGDLPNQLVLYGPDESHKWLTGTPVLDVATLTFALLGLYSYFRGRHPLRARLLLVFILLGVILSSTSLYVTGALLLPVAYLCVANGLAYLLQSWFTVFPRNPAARTLGIVIIVTVIAVVSSYHLKRYFVAWPNSIETKQTLSQGSEQVVQ